MLGKIKVFYYNNIGQLVDTAQMKYEINDNNEIENQIENDDIIDEIANTAGADDWAVEVYNSEDDSIYAASSKY